MWQAAALITALLLPAAVPLPRARGVHHSQAKLSYRCEAGCSTYDSIMERTLDLTKYGDVPADTVAVRVCSKEPLVLALSLAAMNPFRVAKWLRDVYQYSPERVVFLRSEDCLGTNPKVAATELWAVPKGAAWPASVESIKSSQAHFETVGIETLSPEGTRGYRAAAKDLAARLRAKPGAVGVVLGYYYKQPNPKMEKKLREVKMLLARNGLPPDRYFVRLAEWTGGHGDDDLEPRYPILLIVEVARNSARR